MPYIVMDYLPNGSVEARLNAGSVSIVDAVRWTRNVLAGLGHAHALGVLDTEGEHVRIATRLGDKEGKLVRVRVTLPADVGLGVSVSFEATVFITTDWPIGRNFIGYGGFVQGIRMALDPQNNVFYFGSY